MGDILDQILFYKAAAQGDIPKMMDIMLKKAEGTPKVKAKQDLNGDGKVNSKDDKIATQQAKAKAKGPGAGAYASNIIGHGVDLIGRLIQGGGLATQALLGGGSAAAGALAQALASTPSAGLNALQSQKQRDQYGSGIHGGAGNIMSTLGAGAGTAIPALGAGAGAATSALTGALGTWTSDVGNALKLAAYDDFLNAKVGRSADNVRAVTEGLTSPQTELVSRTVSADAAASRH